MVIFLLNTLFPIIKNHILSAYYHHYFVFSCFTPKKRMLFWLNNKNVSFRFLLCSWVDCCKYDPSSVFITFSRGFLGHGNKMIVSRHVITTIETKLLHCPKKWVFTSQNNFLWPFSWKLFLQTFDSRNFWTVVSNCYCDCLCKLCQC